MELGFNVRAFFMNAMFTHSEVFLTSLEGLTLRPFYWK